MIEAAFGLAAFIAGVSALAGSRTSTILLALAASCLAMGLAGVPFEPLVWMAVDTLAILAIAALSRPMFSIRDMLVIVLFLAAWAFYQAGDEARYPGSMFVATLQLLLSYRHGLVRALAKRLVERWKATFDHRHEWTDLERGRADA